MTTRSERSGRPSSKQSRDSWCNSSWRKLETLFASRSPHALVSTPRSCSQFNRASSLSEGAVEQTPIDIPNLASFGAPSDKPVSEAASSSVRAAPEARLDFLRDTAAGVISRDLLCLCCIDGTSGTGDGAGICAAVGGSTVVSGCFTFRGSGVAFGSSDSRGVGKSGLLGAHPPPRKRNGARAAGILDRGIDSVVICCRLCQIFI